MNGVKEALGETSNIPARFFLAIASTLYALTTLCGPDLANETTRAAYSALPLASGLKWSLVLVFAADAFFLWWRLLDDTPRRIWAVFTNVFTFSLWASITGATIFAYRALLPDSVGEIMVTLASFYVLMRTDRTWRDVRTA